MQAWQFDGNAGTLVLAEVPEPEAGPGEVLIAVKAAGLCHSDIGIVDGHLPLSLLGKLPITLGHEVAGEIVEVGEGAERFAPGDRVGLHMSARGPGMAIDGGYAPLIKAPTDILVPIPDGVDFDSAAAGTDAGMTAYRAVKIAGEVTAGQRVGIVGLGGLGLIGAQIARALGAEVYGVEPRREIHDVAAELGVKETFVDVADLASLELDTILDFAGFGNTTTVGSIQAARRGGRVVQVGLGDPTVTLSLTLLVQKRVTLVGSAAGTPEDLASVYDLMATGQIKPVISTITFEEIGDGIDRVRGGRARGRLVARFEN
ncbi:zinc-binding dehydrogenase [Georgenia sp. AZ-5]|uniref:zinc-binding dehydrogenase n=1 Tax=Georgenia sp. AZ-5 TaxID=3367526 RepID=UPI0037542362